MKPIDFHLFADASNLACSAVTIAVAEQTSGTVKGLLTSKSRISKRTSISRLELVGTHMAANMNNALLRQSIKTIVIWLDSMVVPYKVFVSNRIKKIIEITSDLAIIWKHCPSSKNPANLGSRGAPVERLKYGN